jgi:adenylate cyclase
LQIQRLDGSTQVFAIDKPVLKIGRAEDNDVILNDPERSVSRWHAQITCQPDAPAMLSDLNSANGTAINGRPVSGPVALIANDCITVGKFRIVFREDSTDVPFTIRTSALDLHQLQEEPQLLALTSAKEFATPSELRSLEVLYEVGMSLARSQSVEEVSAAAVELLFKLEEVQRATVMLWNENRASFQEAELHLRGGRRIASESGRYDPRTLVMSRTILNKVRQENRPLLIRDAKTEAALRSSVSIVSAGIQAAFCSPLSCQGRFLGVLYADNLARPDAFSEADFRTFTAIAAQTGLALGNAIASKELVAREVERRALKAYLPPQVANLILASDGSIDLSGTLQEVTVLFADIRGFTQIAERMDAREVVQMLNELFTTMTEVIFRCEGTVDKFIGDCIMALFGAPLASERSADQALSAAIAMQKLAMRLNASRSAVGLAEMHIGIGLHTGPAVVGNIGSADRVQYTAIGDTVNVASRLVSRAEPDQIVVSEAFRNALSRADHLDLIGETELRGRQRKLNIYSVKWADVPASANPSEPEKAHDGAI